MKQLKNLRLLAIGLLLSFPLCVEAMPVCLPDSLSIGTDPMGFTDGQQSNPGLGGNASGGGFSDSDQSNPSMGGTADGGFSDGDMIGGGSSSPSTGGGDILKPQEVKNVIIYTTTDEQVITPADAEALGVSIVSNTYVDHVGKLSLSADLTSIGEGAFEDCETLRTVTLPSGVTEIGNFAFSGCTALECIILPASVETFGRYVFGDCETLADVTNLSRVPQSIGKNVFAVYGTLHVLSGCKEAYEAAAYWKNFTIVEDAVDPNVPTLKDGDAYTLDKDTQVSQLTYSRTLSNTVWQPLYVPFSISIEALAEKGVLVAKLNDTHMYDRDDDGVFEEVTVEFLRMTSGSTKANYPYLIRANEACNLELTLQDVTLAAAAETSISCSTIDQVFTFTGTYTGVDGQTLYDNHYYVMSGGSLTKVRASAQLKPQRWYMKIENKDGSPIDYGSAQYAGTIRVMVDGEYGLSLPLSPREGTDSAPIFDLQGRKMDRGTRLPAGIYVQSGKKIVIR